MCHFLEPDAEIPLDVVSQPSIACVNKMLLLTSSLNTSLACPKSCDFVKASAGLVAAQYAAITVVEASTAP